MFGAPTCCCSKGQTKMTLNILNTDQQFFYYVFGETNTEKEKDNQWATTWSKNCG